MVRNYQQIWASRLAGDLDTPTPYRKPYPLGLAASDVLLDRLDKVQQEECNHRERCSILPEQCETCIARLYRLLVK